MIKYFLASLTVPEEEMWVNLSPYEKDRIIPDTFGQTGMGMDLLAEDYLLKQLTASWKSLASRRGEETGDAAMVVKAAGAEVSQDSATRGGIDFNADFLNLKIRRDDNGIPLPVNQQPIQELMEIKGLMPVIIHVTPIQSLPLMLGLEPMDEEKAVGQLSKAL